MTTPNKYFLKQAASTVPCRFDCVDQTIYEQWSKVVDANGEKLYCGIGFECTPKGPKIKGDLSWAEFGIAVRIMAVDIPTGAVPGGFVRFRTKSGNYRPYEIKCNTTDND